MPVPKTVTLCFFASASMRLAIADLFHGIANSSHVETIFLPALMLVANCGSAFATDETVQCITTSACFFKTFLSCLYI
jgi:hypothetical protein